MEFEGYNVDVSKPEVFLHHIKDLLARLSARRPGPRVKEIGIRTPNEEARLKILSDLTIDIPGLVRDDLLNIAASTECFVGTDLTALVNKAGSLAIKKVIDQRKLQHPADEVLMRPLSEEEKENLCITIATLKEATTIVKPSFTIPDVEWEDVGGLFQLKEDLHRYIVNPLRYPDLYADIVLEYGYLLYGPSGCGKSLIAQAVANESGASFISISRRELITKYAGDEESRLEAVKNWLNRASSCAPCILFFDKASDLGEGVADWFLIHLKRVIRASKERSNIFVIAETNCVQEIGLEFWISSFWKTMLVDVPTPDERGSIVTALTRNKSFTVENPVGLVALAKSEKCDNFNGVDLRDWINAAGRIGLASQADY